MSKNRKLKQRTSCSCTQRGQTTSFEGKQKISIARSMNYNPLVRNTRTYLFDEIKQSVCEQILMVVNVRVNKE